MKMYFNLEDFDQTNVNLFLGDFRDFNTMFPTTFDTLQMQTKTSDEQATASDTWVMLDVAHTDNPSKKVSDLF